jgi:addiction module RelE/StbE family toxin
LKVLWSRTANWNRDSQVRYIGQSRPEIAITIDAEIDRTVGLLAEFPELGRPGRMAGTREIVIRGTPYVVVYRILGDEIRILRFLHGAQYWF